MESSCRVPGESCSAVPFDLSLKKLSENPIGSSCFGDLVREKELNVITLARDPKQIFGMHSQIPGFMTEASQQHLLTMGPWLWNPNGCRLTVIHSLAVVT